MQTTTKHSSSTCFGVTKTKESVTVDGVKSTRETVTKRDGMTVEKTSNWGGRTGTVMYVLQAALVDTRYPPEARTKP